MELENYDDATWRTSGTINISTPVHFETNILIHINTARFISILFPETLWFEPDV